MAIQEGGHTLKVKLSAPTASPVTVRLTTDSTTEFFNVSDELSIGLSSARTDGNWYDISISAAAAEAGTKATLAIYRRTTAWSGV